MQLRTISSCSAGNSYALDSGDEILLLEAGVKHTLMTKAIGFRNDKVVGCCVSHRHIDHSKYAEEYAKRGVKIFCNNDVAEKKIFPFGTFKIVEPLQKYHAGRFLIIPIPLFHDVPNNGYIIKHPDMGVLLFITDTYKLDFNLTGVDHFLMEANYDDRILKANVQDGKIDRAQANRLMVSHMELGNSIHFMKECHAEKAKTITLCHLSERNSDPDTFRERVSSTFGIPTYIAQPGLVVELSKQVI